jgi:hypothetical protein
MAKPRLRVLVNEEAVVQMSVHILQERGWICTPPDLVAGEMLTPAEICARYKLKPGLVWRRLHSPFCPKHYDERSPHGRLRRLVLTPALIAYLTAPKTTNAGLDAIAKKRKKERLPSATACLKT